MRRLLHCFSILLLTALVPVVVATGAQATTVSVVPADTTVSCEGTFTVRVATDASADLRGYQLIFSFDPLKLQLLGADPGGVLTGSGNPYSAFLVPDVAAPADSAWYDAGLLGWSNSNPGILVFFRFKALHVEGDSPIRCEWVDFRDSNNTRTLPACEGGLVHVSCPVPSLPQTWGRIKTLYR